MINKMSISDALEDGFFSSVIGEDSQNNYNEGSIEAIIEQIIQPILKTFEQLPRGSIEDQTQHAKHIKGYKKDLRKVTQIDHTEAANRALDDRGIIGEADLNSIILRGRKTEWNCCLKVSERLGDRLAAIVKANPELGNVFTVQVDADSPSYPLVVHLLKSINKKLSVP